MYSVSQSDLMLLRQTYHFGSFILSNFCMRIYIDGAIPRRSDKFDHFVTVELYQDLHKLKSLIYSVHMTLKEK